MEEEAFFLQFTQQKLEERPYRFPFPFFESLGLEREEILGTK